MTETPKKKRTKSPLWINADFKRIYNNLVKSRLRHPDRFRNANLVLMAKEEHNQWLKEQEENKDKTQAEIDRQKQAIEEQKRAENPLQYGLEPQLKDDMIPDTYVTEDGYLMVDYAHPKKRKDENSIWNF